MDYYRAISVLLAICPINSVKFACYLGNILPDSPASQSSQRRHPSSIDPWSSSGLSRK
ncbi:MAG: hypothetical protein M1280_03660 [Actinobacteria bacterium]|nr:hypothetical protein [Actinomycetota bacterium]